MQTSSSDLITIIVPVYNEARTVRQVIDRLLEIPLPVAREIIVVNDGSTDGTREVLDAIAPVDGVLSIVHAAANGGKGSALRIGLVHARGTIVAIQDADLELDPVQLGGLVQPILARRSRRGVRLALSGGPATGTVDLGRGESRADVADQSCLFGGSLTDMETCYKIMTAPVARGLELESNRFDIEPEITAKLLRQRRRIVERPVTFDPRNRASGKKIGWRDGVHAIAVLVKLRIQMKIRLCSRSPCRRGGRRRGRRLRARHVCRRWIGFVVLRADGRCIRARHAAADKRSRCTSALARSRKDIHTGWVRDLGNESLGVGAGMRARVLGAPCTVDCRRRPRRDFSSDADSPARCWCG